MTARRFECDIHQFVVAVEGADARVVPPQGRRVTGCGRCDEAVSRAFAEADTRRLLAIVDAAVAVMSECPGCARRMGGYLDELRDRRRP